MPANFSAIWSAIQDPSQGAIAVGTVVTDNATRTAFVVANSANLAVSASGVPRGVAITQGSNAQAFVIQQDGIVEPENAPGIGVGNATDFVNINAGGNMVRSATFTAGSTIGKATKSGGVILALEWFGGIPSGATVPSGTGVVHAASGALTTVGPVVNADVDPAVMVFGQETSGAGKLLHIRAKASAAGSNALGGEMGFTLGKSDGTSVNTVQYFRFGKAYAIVNADASDYTGSPTNPNYWGFHLLWGNVGTGVCGFSMGQGNNGIGGGVAGCQIAAAPGISIASHTGLNLTTLTDPIGGIAAVNITNCYDRIGAEADEVAFDWSFKTQKATGDDCAFRITRTDAASPGKSRYIDIKDGTTRRAEIFQHSNSYPGMALGDTDQRWQTLTGVINHTDTTTQTLVSYPVNQGNVVTVRARIEAKLLSVATYATWWIEAAFFRVAAGALTAIGSTISITPARGSNAGAPPAGWAVAITASGNNAIVTVTAANNVRSFAAVDIIETGFSSESPSGFSPSDLSGMVFWHKSDTGVTGTSPVTAWADQSGNGNNFAAASGGPTLVAADLNGFPALSFTSGSNNHLETAASIPYSTFTGLTIAVVLKYTAIGNYGIYIANAADEIRQVPAGQLQLATNATNNCIDTVDRSGAYHVVTATHLAATNALVLRVGGVVVATDTGGALTNGIAALGRQISGSFPGTVRIVEDVVYNRVLNSTELGNIEGYLASRYAL